MKKTAILILSVLVLTCALSIFILGQERSDFQAIKKAVDLGGSSAGKEVKWFKILVVDNRTGKEKVKVTLPVSVVEIFLNFAKNSHVKLHEGDHDIDIAQVFAELKKMGPMSIIEVNEDDETVKIWLE